MSGLLTMFDSVDLGQIPADAQALAAYVDGRFANSAEAADRFPHAHLLTIAVFPEHDAMCLDIEQGDATPADAADWFARQKARGVVRPCLYASAFTMDTEVIPAITAAGINRAEVRLWSAHYSGIAHICGPGSCRELGIDADGTQWTDSALQRNLDQSLLVADFFGAAPPPPVNGWTAAMISNLPLLVQGATGNDVRTLQGLLIARGHSVTVDGRFGPATRMAVLSLQAQYGLTEDAKVGPLTWTAAVTGQHG